MKNISKKEILKNLDQLGIEYNKVSRKKDLEQLLMDNSKGVVLDYDPSDFKAVENADPQIPKNKNTFETLCIVTHNGKAIQPGKEITLPDADAKRLINLGALRSLV